MKKQMMDPANRAYVLEATSDKYRIDESKRPGGATPNESFRKLNIDWIRVFKKLGTVQFSLVFILSTMKILQRDYETLDLPLQ